MGQLGEADFVLRIDRIFSSPGVRLASRSSRFPENCKIYVSSKGTDLGELVYDSDQSHLTRGFKRFLGITAGRYIRKRKI
jgi:hypothetical protein